MLVATKVGRNRQDYGTLRAGCFQYRTKHVGNIIAATVQAAREMRAEAHPYYITRRDDPIAVVQTNDVVRLSSDILPSEEEDIRDAIRIINRDS